MGVLSAIEPQSVFSFFEEISQIPHGSGNEKQLSDHIRKFAQKKGLFCIQDTWDNLIIIKEASPGYEEEEPVILQGHMDMVAVKEPDCDIDLQRDPLRLCTDGEWIRAEGTSLGGDDGIAVAYMLALLDSDAILHPRLEMILTVGEEVGLEGAERIDISPLRGRRMINLDNEEEGVFLTSCAGGARVDCELTVSWEERSGLALQLQIDGLKGGHSGAEIGKEGGNAGCLMGRLLDALTQTTSAALVSLESGHADNAIPKRADAVVLIRKEEKERAMQTIRRAEEEIRAELAVKDPGFRVFVSEAGERTEKCLRHESMQKAVAYLEAMPNGVQAMSADVEGLVETSLNLGILRLSGEALLLQYSIRSSLESAKLAVCRKLQAISALAGAKTAIRGNYPGWAYRADSPFRDKLIGVYEEMYGVRPSIQAIHAGLECGFFIGKIPDLDCVSLGPDMKDIHTTQEKLNISSTKRVWEYLLEVLKRK